MYQNLSEADLDNVVEQIEQTYSEGGAVIMTMAGIYMEKGKQEAKIEVAKNLLVKGFSV